MIETLLIIIALLLAVRIVLQVRQGDAAGCGSVLVAWGQLNAEALKLSSLPGKYISLSENFS